ncbi:MAG: hypothetical protein V5B40_24435 [Candidatus Accumulibacter meliphilus]|jgi:hypothetical protein|uniref:hypothetical protein n=1 Tax=Candidatus Accumulibacter meliphilus TaxID=2211374 RepID=UPI002FC3536C
MADQKKWVSGSLPKRGSARTAKPAAYGAAVTERLLRTQQRRTVGRPLATAIDREADAGRGLRPALLSIPGLIAMAIGVLGGLLATVQASLPLAGLAIVSFAGGLGLVMRARAARRGRSGKAADISKDAAKLDTFLAQVAPRLPHDAARSLAGLKETLARAVDVLANEQKALVVPVEEQFFVREIIARYLPDMCRHYLSVRDASKGLSVRPGEKTPEESLQNQLDVLHGRLRKVLELAAADEVRKLANHETFINSKR